MEIKTMNGAKSAVYNVAIAMISLAVVITACATGANPDEKPSKRTITIYGFSVQEEVMTKEIFPAFARYWTQKTGQEVIFRGVFLGSEEVVAAIMSGAPADVAILSNEQHATWLHINSYIESDWHNFPHDGIMSHSPLVIVVRPGNPLQIRDWKDLTRSGIRLVHANPRKSGGAQWALLAEYGSAALSGASYDEAKQQMIDIWTNVVSSPDSSRMALEEFLFGVGDALITYEQDALLAQSRGATFEVVMPPMTIMSEHIVTTVDRNVSEWEEELISTFASFLWSEFAQQALGRCFFRPVNEDVLTILASDQTPSTENGVLFSEIEMPFTVRDLGGWGRAYPEIVQGIWEEQIAPFVSALSK